MRAVTSRGGRGAGASLLQTLPRGAWGLPARCGRLLANLLVSYMTLVARGELFSTSDVYCPTPSTVHLYGTRDELAAVGPSFDLRDVAASIRDLRGTRFFAKRQFEGIALTPKRRRERHGDGAGRRRPATEDVLDALQGAEGVLDAGVAADRLLGEVYDLVRLGGRTCRSSHEC